MAGSATLIHAARRCALLANEHHTVVPIARHAKLPIARVLLYNVAATLQCGRVRKGNQRGDGA